MKAGYGDIVAGWLLKDKMDRARRDFPLLTPEECEEIWGRVIVDYPASSSAPYVGIRDMYHGGYLRQRPSWSDAESAAIENMTRRFTLLGALFSKFPGKFIAAGGSVFRALPCLYRYGQHDCDLFFVGCDSTTQQSELIDLLTEALSFLTSEWTRVTPAGQTPATYVARSAHAVTLTCTRRSGHVLRTEQYQFVLRAYPTAGHVLGGFDIQAAAVCYDGFRITGTEFGFWSAVNRIIIADTTRRSTSYESRLAKYGTYCTCVFPGLDGEKIEKYVIASIRAQFNKRKERAWSRRSTHGGVIDLTDLAPKGRFHKHLNVTLRTAIIKRAGFNDDWKLTTWDELHGGVGRHNRPDLQIVQRWSPRDYDVIVGQGPAAGEGKPNLMARGAVDFASFTFAVDAETTRAEMLAKLTCPTFTVESNTAALSATAVGDPNPLRVFQRLRRLMGRHGIYREHKVELYAAAEEVYTAIRATTAAFRGNPIDLHALHDAGMDINSEHCYPSFRKFASIVHRIHSAAVENVRKNTEIAIAALSRLEFITENPGRQWTASFNPIFEEPREWYGDEFYKPVRVGSREQHDLETTLRLLRRRRPFMSLPRDVFNIILVAALYDSLAALLRSAPTTVVAK